MRQKSCFLRLTMVGLILTCVNSWAMQPMSPGSYEEENDVLLSKEWMQVDDDIYIQEQQQQAIDVQQQGEPWDWVNIVNDFMMPRAAEEPPPYGADLDEQKSQEDEGEDQAIARKHMRTVTGLAVSPDGRTLASVGLDKKVLLWNLHSGKVSRFFEVEYTKTWNNQRIQVAFSPDGKQIASYDIERVQAWDVVSGKKLTNWSTPYPSDFIGGITFSTDQTITAVLIQERKSSTISLVNVQEDSQSKLSLTPTPRVLIQRAIRKDDKPAAAALSPDGKLVASAGHDIRLWPTNTQESVWLPTLYKMVQRNLFSVDAQQPMTSLFFSPGGHTLAAVSANGCVHLWDMTRREKLRTLKNKASERFFRRVVERLHAEDNSELIDVLHDALRHLSKRINAVAFSPDGRFLATANEDDTIWLWDTATGKRRHILQGHTDRVTALAFSSNGQFLASGSQDTTLRVWRLCNPEGHLKPTTWWVDGTKAAASGQHLWNKQQDKQANITAFAPSAPLPPDGDEEALEGYY